MPPDLRALRYRKRDGLDGGPVGMEDGTRVGGLVGCPVGGDDGTLDGGLDGDPVGDAVGPSEQTCDMLESGLLNMTCPHTLLPPLTIACLACLPPLFSMRISATARTSIHHTVSTQPITMSYCLDTPSYRTRTHCI